MIKKLINSIQETLIKKGLCPGCTYPLDSIKKEYPLTQDKSVIQCKCKRMFVKDKKTHTYRRATLEEAIEALENSKNKK